MRTEWGRGGTRPRGNNGAALVRLERVNQELAEFVRVIPVCCYSLFMNPKQIKSVVVRVLVAIVLAMLFVSLLAQRLFHPR